MPNPEYTKAKRLGLKTYYIKKSISLLHQNSGGVVSLGRGFEQQVLQILQDLGLQFEIINRTQEGKSHHFRLSDSVKLRDYQAKALIEAYRYKRGVIVAPAGAGKTITGLSFIATCSRKTLWLTHTKELFYQTARVIESVFGEKPGLLGDNKDTVNLDEQGIVVAMVKTLINRPNYLQLFRAAAGCVVVDEAHHVPSTTFSDVLSVLEPEYMIGLTATPERKDQHDYLLTAHLGEILYSVDRTHLYDEGNLVVPKLFPIYTKHIGSYSEGSIDIGDTSKYHETIDALTKDIRRSELVCQTIADNYYANVSIVIGDRVEYLKMLRQLLEVKHDIKSPIITGDVSSSSREHILNLVKSGDHPILFATSQLVREGLDLPELSQIFLVTPMQGDVQGRKDGAALEQAVGRVMRADPNNKDKEAFIFDFVDYDNDTFKRQWYNRRKVYKRLGIDIPPKKKRTLTEELEDILF